MHEYDDRAREYDGYAHEYDDRAREYDGIAGEYDVCAREYYSIPEFNPRELCNKECSVF